MPWRTCRRGAAIRRPRQFDARSSRSWVYSAAVEKAACSGYILHPECGLGWSVTSKRLVGKEAVKNKEVQINSDYRISPILRGYLPAGSSIPTACPWASSVPCHGYTVSKNIGFAVIRR